MARWHGTLWTGLWVALIVILAPDSAWSQPAEPSPAQLARAKQHFDQGERHYKAGHYDKAIAEYEAAFEAAPLPALRFNIAQAARLAGDKTRARDEYLTFLELAPGHDLADQARLHVADLTRDIERERAREPQPEPRATPSSEQSPTARPAIVVEGRRDGAAPASSGLRVAGLVTAGVGLVSIGAGVYFGLDARSIADDLSDTTGMWTDAELDRQKDGQRSERLMYVFTGLGGAAAIAGTAMFLYGSRSVDAPATVAFDVTGQRASVALIGRF